MKSLSRVSLERLAEEPYASVICYPRQSKAELTKRLRELGKLGIVALEFAGEKEVSHLRVLGKGCVGVVAIAYRDGERVALKIRRVDADRMRMQNEARMLRKANAVQVGPKVLGASRNFLLMRFIDGCLLPEWLDKRVRKAVVRNVLRDVLEQCWRLDKAGLDHGELSRAPKHVIIDEQNGPVIVDFETSSLNRRPANVTSMCQFLFISGSVAKRVSKRLGGTRRDAVVEALRRYKKFKTRDGFERVLSTCGL